MENNTEKIREKIFGVDDVVTDGVYCVAPNEEDMKFFRDYAKKYREEHKNKEK